MILDTAGQKGTGKWTVDRGARPGHPADADRRGGVRALPVGDEGRARRGVEEARAPKVSGSRATAGALIDDLRQALYASKIISYAQGYQLLRAAAQEYNWKLNYGGIALVWRGGCIIRWRSSATSRRRSTRRRAGRTCCSIRSSRDAVTSRQSRLAARGRRRRTERHPGAGLSSALAYFDGYRSERLPANLLQAQRDFFGAHTYERVDKPRGEFFHTNWTGHGGSTTSRSYKRRALWVGL